MVGQGFLWQKNSKWENSLTELKRRAYLSEANITGVLSEASSAHIQAVLPDQPVGVLTDSAEIYIIPHFSFLFCFFLEKVNVYL